MNDNPNLVSSESQNGKILEYLRKGETITALESLKLFKCMRLASRMSDLDRKGIRFDSTFVKTPTGKRVKAYFIPEAFAEKHHLEVDKDLAAYAIIHATDKIAAIM